MSIPIILTQLGLGAMGGGTTPANITLVGTTSAATVSGDIGNIGPTALPLPSGTADGDLLVLSVTATDGGGSGYPRVYTNADGTLFNLTTVGDYVDGLEPMPYYGAYAVVDTSFYTTGTMYVEFTHDSNDFDQVVIVVAVFRGIDGTLLQSAKLLNDSSNTDSITPALSSSITSGNLLVATTHQDANNSSIDYTPPSGWTEAEALAYASRSGIFYNTGFSTGTYSGGEEFDTGSSAGSDRACVLFEFSGPVPPPSPEHVGTVTQFSSYATTGFVSGSSLDISSIDIQAGDIGIIAFTSSWNQNAHWDWGGDIVFEQLVNNTYNDLYQGSNYVGYATLDGTETEIFMTNVASFGFPDLSIVFSVFRNVGYVNDICMNYGNSASLTPPDLPVTSGSMVVVTGHLDDDAVTMTAPTNYTLAGATSGAGSPGSGCAIAYRSDHSTGTEDPSAFGGAYSDEWFGCTLELTATDTRPYKLMDTKVVTVTDARQFDAAGDFDISGLNFQAGDLAFIDICSDEGGITSYSWGGDVDFAELNNSPYYDVKHYQGWAILDGTETDIHLSSGTASQLLGGIISLGIWRGPTYPVEKTTVQGNSTGSPAVSQPTVTAGDMRIACGHLDDDVLTLPAAEGHQQLATQGNVNTGTYSCSSAMSWQTYNTDSYSHSNRFPEGTDSHSSIAYRFTHTKPAAHTVNLIGTAGKQANSAAFLDDYADGLDLPGSFQTGDYLVISLASSGDYDSDFYCDVNGLSGTQTATIVQRYGSSTFNCLVAYLEINTTTLGSNPRIRVRNGSSNVDNIALSCAIFRGPTGVGQTTFNVDTGTGRAETRATTDWVQRGSLLVLCGNNDYEDSGGSTLGTCYTAPPTGWTEAVVTEFESAGLGYTTAGIAYKTDFETGLTEGGTEWSGNVSGENQSVLIEFTTT